MSEWWESGNTGLVETPSASQITYLSTTAFCNINIVSRFNFKEETNVPNDQSNKVQSHSACPHLAIDYHLEISSTLYFDVVPYFRLYIISLIFQNTIKTIRISRKPKDK